MTRLLPLLFLLPALSAQTPAPDPLDALAGDSPFVPPANRGSRSAPGESGPLELRGVVFENGGYSFSLYNQGTHEATWVRLGEKGQPFEARSFNRERDTLTVDYQGRTMVLALPAAKMATAAAIPGQPPPVSPSPLPTSPGAQRNNPVPAAGSPSGAQNQNQSPAPASAANPTEAQRLQNSADEIRRRRGGGPQPIEPPKN